MPDVAAGLAALARPGGAFAMVALDQRESLRTMLAQRAGGLVSDEDVAAFKVEAARALTPHASAVLLDTAGLAAVLAARVLASGCALIVAADRLDQAPGEPVESTDVDHEVLADDEVAEAADAWKLLVIWRHGREEAERERIVRAFLEGCRRRGRAGIVEGIVRPQAGERLGPDEHVARVVEAARELGALGPDLYKAEVPTLGAADDAAITDGARQVTSAVPCPWVVLSNGTRADRFADAAVAACRGGASGFLAGRAIWQATISADDRRRDLETAAARRLRELAARVDTVTAASGARR